MTPGNQLCCPGVWTRAHPALKDSFQASDDELRPDCLWAGCRGLRGDLQKGEKSGNPGPKPLATPQLQRGSLGPGQQRFSLHPNGRRFYLFSGLFVFCFGALAVQLFGSRSTVGAQRCRSEARAG